MIQIALELPAVKLAVVEADAVRVEASSPEAARELEEECERLRRMLTPEAVAALPAVRSVRAMFHDWGVDPARYRPSSEALLRRIAQGKGLYRVSNVVDINNLGSVETGWPFGSYDRGALQPPLTLRAGREGESYEGIGKHTWHLAGRPVLADALGPFGSPISDSTRTMVREVTREIAGIIFAPADAEDAAVQAAMVRFAERLEHWAGAAAARVCLITSGAASALPPA